MVSKILDFARHLGCGTQVTAEHYANVAQHTSLQQTEAFGIFEPSFIHSFIHSFRLFLWRLFKSTTTQRRSGHSTDTVPEFHAEATQATVSDRLTQGPY